MNAVEIEEALTELFGAEFDAESFAFTFLRAFGNKDTTIKRLQAGSTNKSNVDGGVLQRKNIHLRVCAPGEVGEGFAALKESPATQKHRARYVLATDGVTVEAEDLKAGDYIACEYRDFPDHFGTFLALAGIEVVAEIKNNAVDIRAANARYQCDAIHLGQQSALLEFLPLKKENWIVLVGIAPTHFEKLLHRVLAGAQLDLTIKDRFGKPVRPREWFLVPLGAIEEIIERIQDGSITGYTYHPGEGRLVAVE